jgi:hypothetical protein
VRVVRLELQRCPIAVNTVINVPLLSQSIAQVVKRIRKVRAQVYSLLEAGNCCWHVTAVVVAAGQVAVCNCKLWPQCYSSSVAVHSLIQAAVLFESIA